MEYEYIAHQKGLPFKLFLVSIGFRTYHIHAEHELIYVLKGSIDILHASNTIRANQGDFVAINAFNVHGIQQTDTDNLLLILQFKSHESDSLEGNRSIPAYPLSILSKDSTFAPKMAEIIQSMYHISKQKNAGTHLTLFGHYYLLLGQLTNYLIDAKVPPENRSSDDDIARISQIISFVESHFQSKIGLQSLADALHINKYHLSHFMSKKMGISFQSYLNSVRLSYAITLMSHGDHKILDIALQSGFSDHKYLNQLIRETFNCTPKDYQRKLQSYAFELPNAPLGSIHLPFDEAEAMNYMQV